MHRAHRIGFRPSPADRATAPGWSTASRAARIVAGAGALAVLTWLSGCQIVPPARQTWPAARDSASAISQWEGHISVKLGPWANQSAQGQSFGFYMQSGQGMGQLDLMTPLGTQVAQVAWTPQQVRMTTSDGTQEFASLNDLSIQLLGEDIPLQALPHWLAGKSDPSLPQPASQDIPAGASFVQSGWAIYAQDLDRGRLMAQRPLSAEHRQITIQVRLDTAPPTLP